MYFQYAYVASLFNLLKTVASERGVEGSEDVDVLLKYFEGLLAKDKNYSYFISGNISMVVREINAGVYAKSALNVEKVLMRVISQMVGATIDTSTF